MKKVSYFIFIFLSTTVIYGKAQGDGFLGLSLTPVVSIGFFNNQKENTVSNTSGLGFSFIGVSAGYDIITEINFIDDIIHVANYYTKKKAFLSNKEVYFFSFTDIEFSYSFKNLEKKRLNLLAGVKAGHLGYFSSNINNTPWTIYISPVFSLWYFFHSYIALHYKIDFPIGTYRSNISQLWQIRNNIELVVEPYGNIQSPIGTSALFSFGIEYQYIYLLTKEENVSTHSVYFRPYIKFTLLY